MRYTAGSATISSTASLESDAVHSWKRYYLQYRKFREWYAKQRGHQQADRTWEVLNAPLVVGDLVAATQGLELEIGCEIEVPVPSTLGYIYQSESSI